VFIFVRKQVDGGSQLLSKERDRLSAIERVRHRRLVDDDREREQARVQELEREKVRKEQRDIEKEQLLRREAERHLYPRMAVPQSPHSPPSNHHYEVSNRSRGNGNGNRISNGSGQRYAAAAVTYRTFHQAGSAGGGGGGGIGGGREPRMDMRRDGDRGDHLARNGYHRPGTLVL